MSAPWLVGSSPSRRLGASLLGALGIAILSSQAVAGAPQKHAPDRNTLLQALKRAGVLNPDRSLVHFSHTCDLVVDGVTLHVLDVRELLTAMEAPRGFNSIVVLSHSHKPLHTIRYTQERPLWCEANRLWVFGPLALDTPGMPPGNVLVFTDKGRSVSTETWEWKQFP